MWPFRKAPSTRRARGQRGEQLACQFLRAHGFQIEATNVRFPVGEIDIVAREGRTLCFVEVRSAASTAWGGALGSITDRKRRHLIRAARWHLSRLPAPPDEARFDVVAIQWQQDGPPAVELVRGAFTAD